ncbi:hypothetical protein ElyMa_006122500 [Elysia marginata]|uniref:Uncharacterized protein n=1 Tax=Elysia marginata TaxID=1093978 RepID=A0AAV4GYB1_9GAST|nr:hypothetical protein ElyMa_006122500 [Elysia marginata]
MDEYPLRGTVFSVSGLGKKLDSSATMFPRQCSQVSIAGFCTDEQETWKDDSDIHLRSVSSSENFLESTQQFRLDIDSHTVFQYNNEQTKPKLKWKRTVWTLAQKRLQWSKRKAAVLRKINKVKTPRTYKPEGAIMMRDKQETKDSICGKADQEPEESIGTWPGCRKRLNNLLEHFAGETTAHGYKRTLRDTRSSTGK